MTYKINDQGNVVKTEVCEYSGIEWNRAPSKDWKDGYEVGYAQAKIELRNSLISLIDHKLAELQGKV